MSNLPLIPPLKPLHPDASLSPAKLSEMERQTTDVLRNSLLPGQKEALKARPDQLYSTDITEFAFFADEV